MIQIFQNNEANTVEEVTAGFGGGINLNGKWVHLTNPTDREIELVIRASGAPEDYLKAALDEEERARIETDDGYTLILFDLPVIEEESSYFSYSTMPLGVIANSSTVITVCLKENSVIHKFMNGRVKNCNLSQHNKFLFQILYSCHTKFLQYLRQIDKSSQRIQVELHRSTKNKELIQLLDLENSLVYFSTSLRANSIVIERLTRINTQMTEEESELLDDVAVENRQALDMCNIYRDILSGTMDAYASVISNNLNIIMRVLTSLTVIIAVPTLIASFWGMNTGVPFQGKPWGFWLVVGIAAIFTAVSAYMMRKGNNFKPPKK